MIISFGNNKGGTAKTSSALNVAAGLARRRNKTLLVDVDSQANATTGLKIYKRPEKTIYETMLSECPIEDAIVGAGKYLDVAPSSLDLSFVEFDRETEIGRDRLKQALSSVADKYDFIIIDPPPSIGLLSINMIVASEYIFIPVVSEFFSYQGLTQFTSILKKFNPEIRLGGIFITRHDGRKILNRDMLSSVKKHFGDKLMQSVIRENVSIGEAAAKGENIFDYSPKSHGARDYDNLVKEIITITKK